LKLHLQQKQEMFMNQHITEVRLGSNSNKDEDSNLPGSYITSTGSCLPADIGQHPRRLTFSFTGHSYFFSKATPVSFNFPTYTHTFLDFDPTCQCPQCFSTTAAKPKV